MIKQMRAMCNDIVYYQTAATVLQPSSLGWAHTYFTRTAAIAAMDPFQRSVGLDDDAFLQSFEGVHGRAEGDKEAASLEAMPVSAPPMSQVRDCASP